MKTLLNIFKAFAKTLFQGQKHHGYHVLYENLKHEEESVQELAQFVKERATYEEEWNKFLNKCIAKVMLFLFFCNLIYKFELSLTISTKIFFPHI